VAIQSVLGAYLAQLVSDGQRKLQRDAAVVRWEDIYQLQTSAEHVGALEPQI
jgi:hypothetical protein